jgi:cytochrome P450
MEFPIGAGVSLAELTADPHPALARLRGAEPVSWVPELRGWLVSRFDLAQRVLRDASTYTVDDPRFSTQRVVGPSMLSTDGAAHTRHREPFVPPFRPAPVRERFTALVEAEVARLVGRMDPAGAELRTEFAGPLAVAVVADALGLDGADAATVLDWYAAIVDSVSEVTAGAEPTAAGAAAVAELAATVSRPRPGSLLADAAGGLAPPEVVSNAAVLMFGGIDTTEGMITNLALHLVSHKEILDAVRAEPALLGNAIEESVRLEPAAAVVDRYATHEAELGGARIARGDLVTVSIAGANRDPAVFADPDTFDVRRPNARANLAFAQGPHFCVGARLARMETEVAVRALLTLPRLRLARSTAPRGLVFRKPPALHVRWD